MEWITGYLWIVYEGLTVLAPPVTTALAVGQTQVRISWWKDVSQTMRAFSESCGTTLSEWSAYPQATQRLKLGGSRNLFSSTARMERSVQTMWPTGLFNSLMACKDGLKWSTWWKNSLASDGATFELAPGNGINPWASGKVMSIAPLATFLLGWGFLKSCFGVWPKLLMNPMTAFFFNGSSMLQSPVQSKQTKHVNDGQTHCVHAKLTTGH